MGTKSKLHNHWQGCLGLHSLQVHRVGKVVWWVPNYPDCASFVIYSKWPPIKVRENVTSPASSQVVQGGEMVVVPKNLRKSLLILSLTLKSPNGHSPEGVSPFRDVSPRRGYPPYHDVSPQRRASSLPWRQPTEGVSPFRDIRPWRGVSPFHDVSHQRGYRPYHHVQFQLKCKFIPNGTRETVLLPSNNINITVFACWQIFIEAMFSCSQNFRHHFTWYHFLRKFPIVFHSIRIQNYDV